MMAISKFAAIVSLAALGITSSLSATAADVFKWVDENGLTHYSDTAPEDQKADKMPPGLSKLTVVPAVKFVRPQSPSPSISQPQRGTEYRQIDTHAAHRPIAVSEEVRLEEWRAQCVAERWVDCDDRRALYARYGTMADWGNEPRSGQFVHSPRTGPIHR
ncbi:MAG: DUF4124 domain-containing protein [Burkholderiales bacterium]